MNFHPHQFTFAGRLILLIALMIAIGGTAALVYWGNEILPAGRYPIVLFAIPPLCVAGIFIALGMLILKLAGLEFYQTGGEETE
jgi:hypothetical protein